MHKYESKYLCSTLFVMEIIEFNFETPQTKEEYPFMNIAVVQPRVSVLCFGGRKIRDCSGS